MKSNKIIALSFIIMFITSTNSAFAQTATPKPTGNWLRNLFQNRNQEIKQLKQEFKEDRQQIITQFQERRATPKPTLTQNRDNLKATITQTRLERHRNRIKTTYQRLLNSFNKRLTALDSHLTRIQTRLNDKKAKLGTNQNLTDAQTALDSIKNTLRPKLESDISKFKSQADLIINSTDPKALISELKTHAKIVQQDLKDIRLKLVEALRLVVKAK